MANYCIFCGEPTEEGQECSCKGQQQAKASLLEERQPEQLGQQSVQTLERTEQKTMQQETLQRPQQQAQFNIGSEILENAFKRSLSLILEFAKNPVYAVKSSLQKEDYIPGIIFLALFFIASGIFALFNCVRMSIDLSGVKFITYPKALFSGLFIEGIEYILVAAILFGAAALIFKASKSIKAIVAFVGVTTIPLTALLLFNSIFTFLYTEGTGYLMTFAKIASYILCFIGFREVVKTGETKSFLVTTVSIAVASIIVSILATHVGSYGPSLKIPDFSDIYNMFN